MMSNPDENIHKGSLRYAFIAGLSAAAASLFGKLTSDHEIRVLFTKTWLEPVILFHDAWPLRAAFFGFMLLCNAMVWTFFVRALHSDGGSLVATVCSAATNYCVSALFGCLIFGETTSLLWWTGTSFVMTGVVLISTDANNVASNAALAVTQHVKRE